MGTWSSGPFDNDAAADFLDETDGSPQSVAATLRRCADAAPGTFLDADDGQAAIAACELVALGFGYGKLDDLRPIVRGLVRKLGPVEDLRLLAIRAIPRLRDQEHSEIAGLWEEDPAFDAQLADLLARLTEAG